MPSGISLALRSIISLAFLALQAHYDVRTNPEPILSVQGRTNPEPILLIRSATVQL